jgi:histidinol-phosphate aminotransferase
VRLNYNESPFGPSRRARQALLALGEDTSRYAYDEAVALRSLLAEHEGVREENVFVSEGSGEILKLAALLHGEPGRQVIATRPTFTMLPQYASRRGATVEWVDVSERFGHDFAALASAVTSSTSLVYVCNPNNPTGTLADRTELRSFIERVSPRALILVDEAYIDFAPDPQRATVIDLARAGANILVTRSFSKIYGLAGLRVGYGIGPVPLIRRLESLRMSIPNQAGVAAARASVGDTEFCAEIRQKNGESIAFCSRLFGELGIRYAPTAANFMMFDTGKEAADFVEFARERGVMVAPIYEPLTTWVRVSMGRLEDMEVFAKTLRAFQTNA